MKKIFFLQLLFLISKFGMAQLKIYQNLNLQGTQGTCVANTVYKDATVPNGLNNLVKSISLDLGYMATLAEHADGSGERFTFMASKTNLNVNLSLQLQNKVSFIRVLPLPNTKVKKKGAGATNPAEATALNVTWFYNWGLDALSTPATREFCPMVWGSSGTNNNNLDFILAKDSITHYLAFNEPDDYIWPYQSNIIVKNAVPLYKKMLRNGLRMGSPVCTEGKWRTWLDSFYTRTTTGDLTGDTTLGVDYITLHWYDWGNWSQTSNPNPTGQQVFNRFKADVLAAYDSFRKPIWITEFNANINRPSVVHEAFMQLALPWLDSCPYVERYAYFFGNDIAARNSNGTLTAAGQIYANHVSVDAYPENIFDTRPAYTPNTLAAWDPSTMIQGGASVINFDPTTLINNLSVPIKLSRGTGVTLPASGTSNGYWGGSNFSTTTAADGIAGNKIIRFSLKSLNNNFVSYSSIDKLNIRINNIGPVNYQITAQIMYGSTAGPITTVATITSTPAVTGNYSLGPVDLSGFSFLQNVSSNNTIIFRIIPYGASSSLGNFLIGTGTTDTNPDLSVAGIISPTSMLQNSSTTQPSGSIISLGDVLPTNNSFKVYPTISSSNSINANFKSTSKNAQIKIINLSGQIVSVVALKENTTSTTISTNNLSKGSYFIILQDGDKLEKASIIKQ